MVLGTEARATRPNESRSAFTDALELPVPRRPAWNEQQTAAELDHNERSAFLEWRRGLADLEDTQGELLTPFEKNLEVWRQLWRVMERSQLIVQIVDARNPLLFRSKDLERCARAVSTRHSAPMRDCCAVIEWPIGSGHTRDCTVDASRLYLAAGTLPRCSHRERACSW